MRRFTNYLSSDERIRRLEDDLYSTRRTIIDLMPEPIAKALASYYGCETRKESYTWENRTVDFIISQADILKPEEGSYQSDRAYCPLCGQGSSSPYERGFSVPEGLRRHLEGWGNTHRCSVMDVALNLARDYWDRQFSEAEKQEQVAKGKQIADRRKSEFLYRIDPTSDPLLVDEGIGYGGVPRDEAHLEWAEQRVKSLGLTVSTEDRIKTYCEELNAHVVFADIRSNGRIDFRVYEKPLAKKKGRYLGPAYRSFYILDNWKHNLTEKYRLRITELTRVSTGPE